MDFIIPTPLFGGVGIFFFGESHKILWTAVKLCNSGRN